MESKTENAKSLIEKYAPNPAPRDRATLSDAKPQTHTIWSNENPVKSCGKIPPAIPPRVDSGLRSFSTPKPFNLKEFSVSNESNSS